MTILCRCGTFFEPRQPKHRLCQACERKRFGGTPPRAASAPLDEALPLVVDALHRARVFAHPDRQPEDRRAEANAVTARLNHALDLLARTAP